MKLYTEEQVNLAMRLMVGDKATFKQILELLTPIELPKDEDIEKNVEKLFYGEKKYYFKAGIEWMKQHILNQSK